MTEIVNHASFKCPGNYLELDKKERNVLVNKCGNKFLMSEQVIIVESINTADVAIDSQMFALI